jgi:hypothetical protein
MMCHMNTSIQIPLIEFPLSDEDGEPAQGKAHGSSTRELLLGLALGVGALVSVHLVWQVALLALQVTGALPPRP